MTEIIQTGFCCPKCGGYLWTKLKDLYHCQICGHFEPIREEKVDG